MTGDPGGFLGALDEIARDGRSPAEAVLDRYRGAWGGSVDPLFAELAY